MIRFILAALFLVLFLILTIPIMIFEWILGKFSRSARDKSSLAIVLWGFRVILFISGVQINVVGEENVPKDTPVLYIGNHRSFFDIMITYVRVPRPTGYVAKAEMRKVFLLNFWMKLVNCQFLDRKDVKKGLVTILKCIELEKQGTSICIFPEGTRNKEEGTLLPFHDGSFKIAQKSGVPVLPFALSNTAEIFENHFPKIKKTKIVLRYGKPIYINELSKEDQKNIGTYFQNVIAEMLEENKALL